MTIALDTLALARELRQGGFEDDKAETLASVLGRAAGAADVVTRPDLDRAVQELRGEIREVRAEIRLSEQRMTIRLGVMLVTLMGIALGIARVLWHG